METSHIIDIQNEYKRIDNKWLKLQFKTSIILVLFSILIEGILSIVLYNTGEIYIPIPKYVIKYLLAPSFLNIFFVFVGYKVMHSSKMEQKNKIYSISILLVVICFILFSVHSVFTSLYFIFMIPMLFTMIYADYLLTTVTALSSIFLNIISELYIRWDPDKLSVMKDGVELTNFIISISVLCAFYLICLVIIHFEKEKNAASIQKELEKEQLKQKLHKDELTGISNRAALRKALQSMEEDLLESHYIFAMLDVDHFKMLNDTLGHDKGDAFLVEFAKVLTLNCVKAKPFRFGGDEFCILFKNKTVQFVIDTCEKIQKDFEEIVDAYQLGLPLSVSFGIAHYTKEMTAEKLFKHADTALYSSKTVKNAIRIYESKKD